MFPLPRGCYPKASHSVSVWDKHLWDKTAGKRTVILEDRNRACVKYSCVKCSLGTLKVTCQEEQGWVRVNEKIMRITVQIYRGTVLFRAPREGHYSVTKSILLKEDGVDSYENQLSVAAGCYHHW